MATTAPARGKCFFRGGCFVAGTQVVTSEGLKNIEDIEPGDYVLSRNDETGEQGYKRVLDAWETHPPSLIHLFYRRATQTRGRATTRSREGEDHYIVGTSNHPFWSETQQAWIDLGELKTGEYIRLADGALATVEYTEEQWAPEGSTFVTYNFEVADWHTYFVVPEGESDCGAGTWVHNQGGGGYRAKVTKSGRPYRKPGPKTDPNAPHNKKIREVAATLQRQGNKIKAGGGVRPEILVKVRNRKKSGRRPDIIYETPDGKLRGVNVGLSKKDGSPYGREQEALDDLNNGSDIPTTFVPYNR